MKERGVTDSAARAGMVRRLGSGQRLLDPLAVIRTPGESRGVGSVAGVLERAQARRH